MKSPPRHWRYRFLTAGIILAAAAVFVAGSWQVCLWDRDEAWYAQASKQMVESGDWLVTKFLEQPRFAKPIFIYWCQAASMARFGHFSYEFAARLPSAVAMTLTLCLLAIVLGRAFGPRRAMYTVLVFASSAAVLASAKMCLTDSVLLLFLTAAQMCLFAIYRLAGGRQAYARGQRRPATAVTALDQRANGASCSGPTETSIALSEPEPPGQAPAQQDVPRWLPALLWVCIGMAGLTKGPVALVLLGATALVLAMLDVGWKGLGSKAAWRRALAWWPRTRPKMGLLIVAAIVLPWLIAAFVRNPAFLTRMLQEPFRHAGSNQDGQWRYPGYYLISIWATFFPWCLLLPTALLLGWKHRKLPAIRFALAVILANWIFQELMVTKLPHYLLPSFSSLAFLTATALIRCQRRQHDQMLRPAAVVAAAVWAYAVVGLSLLPWVPQLFFDQIPILGAALFTAAGVAYGLSVVLCFAFRRLAAAAAVMGLGMLLVIALLFTLYLPHAQYLRLPQRVGDRLKALGAVNKGTVMMIGYREPSLAFYQGGTIGDQRDKNWLLNTPPEQWPQWIVLSERLYGRLPPEKQAALEIIERHKGLNYNEADSLVTALIARNKLGDAQPNGKHP